MPAALHGGRAAHEAADAAVAHAAQHARHAAAHAAQEQDPAAIAAQQRQAAFQALRPVCSTLLQQRGSATALSEGLATLHGVLSTQPPAGLSGCWDYVTFPLLLVVDSVAPPRRQAVPGSGTTATGGQGSRGPPLGGGAGGTEAVEVAVPAARSDKVAEAALGCLLLLLQRSTVVQEDQVLDALQRLMPLLALACSPGAVSEELAVLTFKCIGAAFAALSPPSLQPNGSASSDAAAGAALTALMPPEEAGALNGSVFLPMAGYMIHTCLQVATAQLNAGAAGSRDIRLAALQSLSHVVASLRSADDAAFFLPGIASGLCRQLLPPGAGSAWPAAAGSAAGGGSGGAACLVAALRCLTDVAARTLGDEQALQVLASDRSSGGRGQAGEGDAVGAAVAAADALGQLQKLSRAVAAGAPLPPPPDAAPAPDAAIAPRTPPPQRPPRQEPGAEGSSAGEGGGPPALTVQRTTAWVQQSGGRVATLLAQVLPPLCGHPRPAVRAAAAQAAATLLARCGGALGATGSRVLLDAVLTLAQDEWQQVCAPCIELIACSGDAVPVGLPIVASTLSPSSTSATATHSGRAAPATSTSFSVHPAVGSDTAALVEAPHIEAAPAAAAAASLGTAGTVAGAVPRVGGVAVEGLLEELASGLLAAVRSGEAKGVLAARRLTSAMLLAGPALTCRVLVERPAVLSQLLGALFQCMAFDPAGALMLLHAQHEGGLYLASPATSTIPSSFSSSPPSTPTSSTSVPASTAQQPAPYPSHHGMSAPQLPRMPPCLLHVTSTRSYEAVASVARCLARQAKLTDSLQAAASGVPGTNLRRLMDYLITKVQAAASDSSSADLDRGLDVDLEPSSGSQQAPNASTWQLPAAVVVVAAEAAFGASGLWQPLFGDKHEQIRRPSDQAALSAPPAASTGDAYEGLVCQLLGELVRPRLWGVPTSNEDASAAAPAGSSLGQAQEQGPAVRLSAQHIARNALLARTLLESAGAAARCLGPHLRSPVLSPSPLRTLLMPLLERLADPCGAVRAAAQAAVASVCVHCGYQGGLAALVGGNADYVVDALCRQLRDLNHHPRAPQLLAALLSQSGVVPELLPLMAEPLRAALQGLSILSRRQQSRVNAYCFLRVLHQVALGVKAEGLALAAQTDTAVGRVRKLVEEQEAAKRAEAASASSRLGVEAGKEACQGEGASGQGSEYFAERVRAKAQKAGVSGVDLGSGQGGEEEGGGEGEGDGERFVMGGLERAETEERLRHVHAAAVLAAAAADAAAPLVGSAPVLRDCISALDTCQAALQGLAACTRSLEADLQLLEEVGGRQANSMSPVRPETPRLLPALAAAWPPLLCALRDARTPVVLRGLRLLSDSVALGGGAFMAGRVRQQALPLLMQLLARGTAASSTPTPLEGGAAGREASASASGTLAPAAVQAVRVAVLECFAELGSGGGGAAVARAAWDVSGAALPFLARSQPPALRAAAAAAVTAMARLDADTVWMLLYDVAVGAVGVVAVAANCEVAGVGKLPVWRAGVAGGRVKAGASGAAVGGWPVTPALRDESSQAAGRLLAEVEGAVPAWHARAPVVAPDWHVPEDG